MHPKLIAEPKRTEVISPVVATTECIPKRKANAATGGMSKTKGSIKARVVAPPNPGNNPTMNPMTIPRSIRGNAGYWKTAIRPAVEASKIDMDATLVA